MFLPYTTITLVIAISVTAFRAWRRDDRRNGILLALVVWGLAVLSTALPILTYPVRYSARVDGFIALSLAAATVGYHLLRKRTIAPPQTTSGQLRDLQASSRLAWVGIGGNALLLVYAIRHGAHLTPSYLANNLSSIRNNELASNGTHGPVGLLGAFFAPASFLFLAVSTKTKLARPLVVLSFVMVSLVALFLYGGRQSIFVAVLLVVTGLWLRGAKTRFRPRTIAALVVVAIGAWYFTTSFVEHRQTVEDPQTVLWLSARAEYGPWTAGQASRDKTFGTQLIQYSYLSSPIPSLMYYIDTGVAPKPLYGEYSFPVPWIFMGVAFGSYSAHQWSDARAKVLQPFDETGFVGNAWATILRDLWVDFGEWGAIAVCGLFGAFIAWARNRYEDTGDVFFHALEAYAALTFAFGAFQSLLWPDWMQNGFFFAVGILVVRHLVAPSGSRRPRPRPLQGQAAATGRVVPARSQVALGTDHD